MLTVSLSFFSAAWTTKDLSTSTTIDCTLSIFSILLQVSNAHFNMTNGLTVYCANANGIPSGPRRTLT
jgi:hypothetical protein